VLRLASCTTKLGQSQQSEVVSAGYTSLPLLHIAVCLLILLGYAVPKLEPLIMGTELLIFADLPISLPTVGWAMGYHVLPALASLFIAGTLWWYLLSLAGRLIYNHFISRTHSG